MCYRIVFIFHFIAAISELERLNLKLEQKYEYSQQTRSNDYNKCRGRVWLLQYTSSTKANLSHLIRSRVWPDVGDFKHHSPPAKPQTLTRRQTTYKLCSSYTVLTVLSSYDCADIWWVSTWRSTERWSATSTSAGAWWRTGGCSPAPPPTGLAPPAIVPGLMYTVRIVHCWWIFELRREWGERGEW